MWIKIIIIPKLWVKIDLAVLTSIPTYVLISNWSLSRRQELPQIAILWVLNAISAIALTPGKVEFCSENETPFLSWASVWAATGKKNSEGHEHSHNMNNYLLLSPGGNGNTNSYYLFHSYCVLGTVLSDLNKLYHRILTSTL